MARKKTDARDKVIEQLVEVFFRHGYEGATLSLIAEQTGLQRASLYHHFPGGKEDMARAVIERSDRWGEIFVRKVATDDERPAPDRLRAMIVNMDEVHSRPEQLTPANAFAIGASREMFGHHVRWHYHGLVWLMSELMEACGVEKEVARRRAWEFRIVWEGALVCSRVLGEMSLYHGLMRRMPDYLLAPADTPGILPFDLELPSIAR